VEKLCGQNQYKTNTSPQFIHLAFLMIRSKAFEQDMKGAMQKI